MARSRAATAPGPEPLSPTAEAAPIAPVEPHAAATTASGPAAPTGDAADGLRAPASSLERLVADLIALMERGQAPWRRPWREESGQHVNLCSGQPYRGSNPVLLSLGMHLRGSALPYWCGWGEARRLGVAPRRGSRGVMILRPLPSRRPKEGDAAETGSAAAAATAAAGSAGAADDARPGEQPVAQRPGGGIRTRPVVVFNAADLVGDEAGTRALAERIQRCRAACRQRRLPEPERLRRATARLEAWPVPRLEGGDRACYLPDLDRIQLPDADRFESASARLATWAHEAIHSTGHPSRLHRDLSGAFGSAVYAREELVAELGAVLLGERLEIGSDTANHAAYLSHWCELLRQEPKQLLQVLGDARRAADRIAPEPAAQTSGEGSSTTLPPRLA